MGEQAAKCPGDPVPSPAPPWAIQMLSHAVCSCEQALQPTQALSKPCLNEHVLLLLLLSLRLMCSGSMILRRKDKEEKCLHTLEPGLGPIRKFQGIEREAVTGSNWVHFLGLKVSSLHGRGVARDEQELSPLRGAQGWPLSSGSDRTQLIHGTSGFFHLQPVPRNHGSPPLFEPLEARGLRFSFHFCFL